jgi:glycerol-1-phosphate dehydrogenase [NAD(P)+]
MCDVLVAVGGGTINDLCKYAAHLDKKPYVVFPTCASMNGYLSANASISVDNHKTTFAASLPKAVLCDIGIIAKAPSRLSKSGLGDSLARPTAQADWLLSHLLLGTDYNETPFSLIVDVEVELFEGAAGIAKNDAAAIKLLMQLLLLSGIGMTIAGGSYPASQGEHMIAHTYNMLAKTTSRTLHGEEIGITSLHMAKRQQSILNSKPQLCSGEFDFDYMSSLFGSELAREFEIEFSKKQTLVASLREGSADEAIHNQERTGLLGRAHNDYFISPTKWDEAREKIEKVTMTPSQMENIIKKAELLDNIKALGWNKETYETAYKTARFTRDRFTFLDIKN